MTKQRTFTKAVYRFHVTSEYGDLDVTYEGAGAAEHIASLCDSVFQPKESGEVTDAANLTFGEQMPKKLVEALLELMYESFAQAVAAHENHLQRVTVEEAEQLLRDVLRVAAPLQKKRMGIRGKGAPEKITSLRVHAAFHSLGKSTSQEKIAEWLDVSPQAIRNWYKREGLNDWSAVKAKYKKQS